MTVRLGRSIILLGFLAVFTSCDGLLGSDDGGGSDMEIVSFVVVGNGAFYEAEITTDSNAIIESNESFSYEIYLSAAPSFSPESADYQIYTDRSFRFDDDGTASISVDYWNYEYEYLAFLDGYIPNGTYYAAILIDSRDEWSESDENNNFVIDSTSFDYNNPEDSREDNDTIEAATAIGDVTYEGGRRVSELYINEGDEDYFRFNVVDAPGTLSVIYDTDSFPASGEVTLYDSDGNALGSNTGTYAKFDHSVSETGTFYAAVRPEIPVSAPYEFVVVLSGPSIPDDSSEENDDPSTATNIGTLVPNTVAGYTNFVSLDDDFFIFDIPYDGSDLTITVLFSHAAGDIDALLVDGSGTNIIRSAQSSTDNETISYDNIPSGTYYLWVLGAMNGNGYDLEFRYEN